MLSTLAASMRNYNINAPLYILSMLLQFIDLQGYFVLYSFLYAVKKDYFILKKKRRRKKKDLYAVKKTRECLVTGTHGKKICLP